jgi:phosphoenolpyruvate carboxylase
MPQRMREDVRLLGDLLGEILRESAGEDLLADVERLRRAVIEARRGPGLVRSRPDQGARAGRGAVPADPVGDEIAALVASWPLDRAELVARAFTVYFHLANLAEEHQRIRTLRERGAGGAPLRESLALAVAELRGGTGEAGVGLAGGGVAGVGLAGGGVAGGAAGGDGAGAGRLEALLAGLRVHPVLTAHPTEARRRAVTAALRRISGLLTALDEAPGGPGRESHALDAQPETVRRLREEIDLLWRTAQLRVKAMEPLDEVRTVMTAFDETLFRVVPALYRALDLVLAGRDSGRVPAVAPAFLRFGSWVGGDRDGNPFVTAQVTRETAIIQADHALRALENATTRIGRALTVDSAGTPPSADLARGLAVAEAAHPELLAEISARSPAEPYRAYMLFIAERLRATRLRHADLAYGDPGRFLADLRLVQDALAGAGAPRQAFGELQHLIWQAETFGFHLAELEVRQHSEVHARALRELDGGGPRSPQTQEVLATFRVIVWIQGRFGPQACRRYVVSFTRSAADVAAVYELARRAVPHGRPPDLDVIPLFESGADLDNAVHVLDDMLKLEPVAAKLAAGSGRALEVMLGYSDSAKELGPVSATLRLFRVQAALAAWASANDVALTLFHGRGGALGRGGGPAGRAVLAQAPGSVDGRFKVTEQGEVIFARYGHLAIAQRHLEQVTSAVMLASAPLPAGHSAPVAGRIGGLAERIEAAALRAYRDLVSTEGFAAWFARISPLEEISDLRIGSRPARRAAAVAGLDDLRAIPWVFAWAQTRVNLPGWFGLGSGLAAIAGHDGGPDSNVPDSHDGVGGDGPGGDGGGPDGDDAGSDSDGGVGGDGGPNGEDSGLDGDDGGLDGDDGGLDSDGGGGLDELRRAYREWPLFAVLLDNAEMSLAKTDRRIAARYLALGGRPDLTAAVLAEYDLTARLVLAVTGHDRLLADRRVLSRAVALRDPYVDALSYLQLRALASLRADETTPASAEPAPGTAGSAGQASDSAVSADRDRLQRLLLLTVNGVAAGLQNTG